MKILLINFFKFIGRCYVFVFPIYLCLVALYPSISESTLRYAISLFSKESVFQYPIDTPVFIIWCVTILWSILGIRAELKKERDSDKKHSEIHSALIGAPNFKSFAKSRRFLDSTAELLSQLNPLIVAIQDNSPKEIYQLTTVFATINALTKKLASEFFTLDEEDIGVNCMIFIEKIAATDAVIDKLLSKEALYVRPDKKSDLLGVLYLPSALNDAIQNTSKVTTTAITGEPFALIIPIYKREAKVYNSPENIHDPGITLPGAPMAFFRGNSFIGDTKDKENYRNLDTSVQNDIITYFTGRGIAISSLVSFAIPGKQQGSCIGVMNIQSGVKSTFDRDDNQFSTFYTMIYPTVKLMNRYLGYYTNSVVADLLKP